MELSLPSSQDPSRSVNRLLLGAAAIWFLSVVALAASGALRHVIGPQFALLVLLGIAAPTVLYFTNARVASTVQGWGLYPLSAFHIWRAPAALLFLWAGMQGLLPPVFWVIAGLGDLAVGIYAMRLLRGPADKRFYRRLHVAGFADFAVAVGLGLTHTLLGDPRMQNLAALPMALIPLFGVGLSGASHLVALSMLRKAR